MITRIPTALCLLALLALIVTGCSDDVTTEIDATLDELWPNEDGLAWTYEMHATFSDTQVDIGPAPDGLFATLMHLRRQVADFAHTGDTGTHEYILNTAFAGEVTTASGATGQRLIDTVFDVEKGAAVPFDRDDAFLSLLWEARPDLRDRLPAPAKTEEVDAPMGITGYCWEKTGAHICGYGDLSQDISWYYLKAPLEAGAVFSLQLVPAIADDIWLHGLVVRQMTWTQGIVSYPRAVEVFTLIDLGEQTLTDETGEIIGTYHPYMAYTTVFASGVGPVYTHEWKAFATDSLVQPVWSPTLVETEAVLIGRDLPN
jgi:hypothetical protein